MKRSSTLFAKLALTMCGTNLSAAGAKHARPNILWLIAEDFGQHLGCFGTKEVWTPNLDRLASERVLYARFYDGMVCSVSRSS
jgi:N-sulfoglucosamine sulfohydrolase